MSSSNWTQFAEILDAVADLGSDEREAFLAQACRGDQILLDRLRSLLAGADAFPNSLGFDDFDAIGLGDISENTTVIASDTVKPDKLVGQVLKERFLITKNLAEDGAEKGGIGIVYLAADLTLSGKKAVVKILQEDAKNKPDLVRKFLHEREALKRLDHPNIVRILELGNLDDGSSYIVMEYIEGHSLRQVLRKEGWMPLAEAAHLIESITDALDAAHRANILHRDIKPENIMLTPQVERADRVRLIDFGIARVENSELAPATTIETRIGTPRYMAPEQLTGQIELTPAADLYAVGILAYEILTGKLPFTPISRGPEIWTELYVLAKEGVKTPPSHLRSDLSPAAERLVLAALEFEPQKRPLKIRSFGLELAAALRTAPSSNAKTEILPLADRTAENISPLPSERLNRPLIWAGIVTMLLALIGLPLGFVLLQGPNSSLVGNPNKNVESLKTEPSANASGSGDAARNNAESGSSGPIGGQVLGVPSGERQLSYFLMVQKMRNGKPFEKAFKSSGQEIYESGYKFRLTFEPDADGYMYLFNEGKDAEGNVVYFLLFPSPSINGSSSQVSKAQAIETAQNTFRGGRGTELIWMIWTEQKQDDLEAVKRSAFASVGAVKDITSVVALREFLEKNKAEGIVPTKDSANQRTVVNGRGDILVHRFVLEHK